MYKWKRDEISCVCLLVSLRKGKVKVKVKVFEMSGVYTCNSCSLGFGSSQDQRNHMKTEWHRYNLKRRVAQLPAITEQVFTSKVNILGQSDNADAKDTKGKEQLTKKELRRREKEALLEKKKKLLALARESMLRNMASEQTKRDEQPETKAEESAKELEEVNEAEEEKKEQESKKDTLDEDLTEEELAEKLMQQKLESKIEIPLETCLFCTKKTFPDFESNLDHMFRNHGFYIPEQKYLIDKVGLVKYLSEKIGLGNVCIVCNYQGRSLDAVRAHMLAKRHCKVPYESENEILEISEFYDFTKSYEAFSQKKHSNITTASEDGIEEEWEDVSDEEGEENKETTGVNDQVEDDIPKEYLYNDGVELHLPTGVKVGHRSLQRYFRQNLKPEKELTEGQGTLVAAETRTFSPAFDKQQFQVRQRVWQTENKDKKRHDKRAAKFINNQPYYRDQLLQ